MTSLYMLDTNMVSYIARGRSSSARARLLGLKDGHIGCISAITEAEIQYGLAKRPDATALKVLMDGFLASIRILPWGRDEAQAYGVLRATIEASGMALGNMDMMIAAHTIATGAILVTNDKAFSQVKDIHATVNWATDI
jgi:tRNA(fMet)-specific endonuclease VapC